MLKSTKHQVKSHYFAINGYTKFTYSDSQKTTRIEELEASGGLGRACEWGGAGGRLRNRGWGSGYG